MLSKVSIEEKGQFTRSGDRSFIRTFGESIPEKCEDVAVAVFGNVKASLQCESSSLGALHIFESNHVVA
jgi:hypothetical protein